MAIATFLGLCVDATSAERLRVFWAAVLGATTVGEPGKTWLELPGRPTRIWVNEVPEPHTAKNRVHLDVHCGAVDDLLAIGAEVVAPPEGDLTWWQLRSPDGDEFCAFVRDAVPANRLYEVVVDCQDAAAQAAWWSALLGVTARTDGDGWYLEDVPELPCEFLVFDDVPEPMTVKNRVHWDVRAGVDDVLARGATLLREPTADDQWHVLADPEGLQFCVFQP